METDKVRMASKRLKRVGDIDCWKGARLAIWAEVKQYIPKTGPSPTSKAFATKPAGAALKGLSLHLDSKEGVKGTLKVSG